MTIDHTLVRAWAVLRRARPSQSALDGRPSPLSFELGPLDAGLVAISWEDFFEEFERAKLAFVYRDRAPTGEIDDFRLFVNRSTVVPLVLSGRSTIALAWS